MLYSVYAVCGVCCTWSMLYSEYAVLAVNSWLWYGVIERDDLTWCSWVMVRLRKRERDMTGDCPNHHEKMGPKSKWSASQSPIPDTAGVSPNQVCSNTNTQSTAPNEAGHTPDLLYVLVSSTLFWSSSQSCCFSSTTLPLSQNTMLRHPLLFLHGMIMCWHWVQQSPSTPYAENCIHPVQHPPKIVCLPFIFMITSWQWNVVSASGVLQYMIDCDQAAVWVSSKVKSSCYNPMVPR